MSIVVVLEPAGQFRKPLVLNAGCTLTASKGITVAKGNKLIIEGSGTLIASTKVEGTANIAGIGGVANQDCGTVIINGGTINISATEK